jgi:hypothetical protein
MLNSKKCVTLGIVITALLRNFDSVYIITMTIANKAKARFYDEDLPGLEDVSHPRTNAPRLALTSSSQQFRWFRLQLPEHSLTLCL